jgi:tRNA dimethylallyltransferase
MYVVRALEIATLTGLPPSEAKQRGERRPSCVLVLEASRELLRERITRRTRSLLRQGWIEEVEALRVSGYTKADPGLESHGYREIFAALEAGRPPSELHADEPLANEIDRVTLAYTKRQRTWWRRDPLVVRLPVPA